MTIKNILALAGLYLVPMIVYSQTVQSLVGFQDIPWGSSIQVVKNKFPQVKARDVCKKDDLKAEAALRGELKRRGESCVNYSIESYAIENNDFNLVFSFSSAGSLKSVTISKVTEGIPSVSTPICQANYSLLNKLLVNRYGAGSITKFDDPFGFKALGFRKHDYQYWAVGPTQIYLSNSWDNPEIVVGLCWVHIAYSPRSLLDSSKL